MFLNCTLMALLPPPFDLLVEQSVYMYLQLIKDEEYWSAGVLECWYLICC
jgi:hypothetical protein